MQFHEMTARQFREYGQRLYAACPKVKWDALKVGDVLLDQYRPYEVEHIPPKRGYAVGRNILDGYEMKLPRKRYEANSYLATPELLAIAKIKHKDAVADAVAAGLPIPGAVRYDYPELFSPMPEAWPENQRRDAKQEFESLRPSYTDTNEFWPALLVIDRIHACERHIESNQELLHAIKAGAAEVKPGYVECVTEKYEAQIGYDRARLEILAWLSKHIETTIGAREA